ncbi:hypothetical protein CH281_18280 [Rhodococcus sp. 06-221-2]|uniref:WhiB family transcriptional regulator n=1 Tax=Nocardiaceae TaxID=85025 RepID=UPI000B9ABF67|nr:WhiB family transcriptional regulator [Rhodococcus sp. 06-221-2]NIL84615.1 Redox- and pH-responsive transcriptional regulator WhiB3 [Rhodococcus fascians]OZD00330.1 hypothetical protein CH281_18280 [Rhodococcus sp. 06-221-2]
MSASGFESADWRIHAHCNLFDIDLFYGPWSESRAARSRRERIAQRICAQCPVIEQCRFFAVGRPELYGVWGGLTESDRHRTVVGSTT